MVAAKNFDVWGLSRAAVILSILLHLAAAAWLWLGKLPPPRLELPPAIDIDLVEEAAPKPPEPAKAPPPPALSPSRPQELPNRPQLEEGQLADRSRPSGIDGAESHTTGAGTTVAREPARKAGKRMATQTVRDKVLSQVLRHWSVPEELKGREATISLSVDVEPGGWLAAPYSAQAPWNPAAAIEHYNEWAAGSLQRRVSESIYRALREAQPLNLPPEVLASAPLSVALVFRPSDVR